MTARARVRSVIGIALLTVLLTTMPSQAADPTISTLACDTKGELTYTAAGGGVFNWTLDPPNTGSLGTCTIDGGTLQLMSLHGDGTSHSLGVCSGNPLVTDFTMSVSARVEGDVFVPGIGTVHKTIIFVNHLWTGLPSAYPSAITFTASGFFFPDPATSAALAHGVLTSRIYKMCPPKGSSRARAVFDIPIYNGFN